MLGLAVAVAFASCNTLSKVLSSSNQTVIYEKGLELYEAKKYQKALVCFDQVAPYFTGTPKADTILFYAASCSYNMGDFEASGVGFDQFRRQFGRSPFLEEAEYMYALGFYYMSPAPQRDQSASLQAARAMQMYLDRYPNSVKRDQTLAKIEEIKQKLFDKAFLNAKVYYDIENYKSAVVAFRNVLDKFPDSNHREDMLYLITKSHYLLAHDSYASLQRERYANMMDAYYTFVSEYPESKRIKELDKMQAEAKHYLARYETDEEKQAAAARGEQASVPAEDVEQEAAQMGKSKRGVRKMDRKIDRIERKANRVAVAEDGSILPTERLDRRSERLEQRAAEKKDHSNQTDNQEHGDEKK